MHGLLGLTAEQVQAWGIWIAAFGGFISTCGNVYLAIRQHTNKREIQQTVKENKQEIQKTVTENQQEIRQSVKELHDCVDGIKKGGANAPPKKPEEC